MDRPALLTNVDPADAVLDRFHQVVDGGQVGQVARQRERRATLRGDALRHRFEQVLPAGHDDHGGALMCEQFGGRFADARRRTGEHHALAAQVDRLSGRPVPQQFLGEGRPHARHDH